VNLLPIAFGLLSGSAIMGWFICQDLRRLLKMAFVRERMLTQALADIAEPPSIVVIAKRQIDFDRELQMHMEWMSHPMWWRFVHKPPESLVDLG